jgi:hypothetical protein
MMSCPSAVSLNSTSLLKIHELTYNKEMDIMNIEILLRYLGNGMVNNRTEKSTRKWKGNSPRLDKATRMGKQHMQQHGLLCYARWASSLAR